MKFLSTIFPVVALLVGNQLGFAQGFVNLDFEDPVLPLTPVFGQVPAVDAIPGWTVYNNGIAQVGANILYNTRNLDAPTIALLDTNSLSYGPLQGGYSVLLIPSSIYVNPRQFPAIGQTGQIPPDALSIEFYSSFNPGFQVTFNGLLIPLVQLGSTPNFDIMGGDVSAFSGQTGLLQFTAGYGLLDNIQFSSSSVPEPSEFALTALGALLLGFRRWRNFLR
jgi:hypothetical protein